MKKISIISFFISLALIIAWVFAAFLWWLFNGLPKQLPRTWEVLGAIPVLLLLASSISFLISIRLIIISEIKQLLKNLN